MTRGSARPIPDSEYKDTLLGDFLDGCIDDLRQIASDLGARPYRVFIIRTRWSGKRRGQGVEEILEERELTPTPKIEPISSVQLQLQDLGMDEVGGLSITEISPRYTENFLLGRELDGSELPKTDTIYWEVRLSRGDPKSKIRRFMMQGIPSYEATRLQWTVRLVRAGSDRDPEGNPT